MTPFRMPSDSQIRGMKQKKEIMIPLEAIRYVEDFLSSHSPAGVSRMRASGMRRKGSPNSRTAAMAMKPASTTNALEMRRMREGRLSMDNLVEVEHVDGS